MAQSALIKALTTTEPCTPCAERAALAAADPAAAQSIRWTGCLVVEGEPTGDGRLIQRGALTWDEPPLLLRLVTEDVGAHDGAVVVGKIDKIRRSDGKILAEGTLDMGGENGREAERQLREGLTTGISVDLDDTSYEVHVASEIIDAMEAFFMGDDEDDADVEDDEPPREVDGRRVVAEVSADDELMVVTSARIRAATLVQIPAFTEARIALNADAPAGDGMTGQMPDGTPCSCEDNPECICGDTMAEALAASAAQVPVAPPRAWFNDPNHLSFTPFTVTPEGRVYGHLATWNSCHIGAGQDGCVNPPQSATGYAYFHTGSLVTSDGDEIAVGRITLNTLHAARGLNPTATIAHYENTGAAVADVRAGEDAYGIWVAGALRPGLSEERLRELRAAPLSGDWRRVGGSLELVAALAVNVAGFPVPRPAGLVASGHVQSLVAAGFRAPTWVPSVGLGEVLSADDLHYLKRLAKREREMAAAPPDAALALARRVKASSLVMRVRSRI